MQQQNKTQASVMVEYGCKQASKPSFKTWTMQKEKKNTTPYKSGSNITGQDLLRQQEIDIKTILKLRSQIHRTISNKFEH